jgi:hypothetical protein
MANPNPPERLANVTVRVTDDALAAADALARRLSTELFRVRRADVLRRALNVGLEALQRDAGRR